MTRKGVILLAAGGTGGHLFPAQALAEVLTERGYETQLVTDERVRDYGKAFPAAKTHIVPSATFSARDVVKLLGAALRLTRGYFTSRAITKTERPLAVAGFGGYPSLTPLLAAKHLGIPTLIHEQNAVMGRANRFLAARVDGIASSFPLIEKIDPAVAAKVVFTGNPVRKVVRTLAGAPYPAFDSGDRLKLLVFGGSQGARFFSEFLPKVLAELHESERRRLSLTQQCRPEDQAEVSQRYRELGIQAEISPFFMDLPARLADCHLVMARSGASTIAELTVIGRPAMLVPLPHALDNDQLRNAEYIARAGAGWCLPQASLDAKAIAARLRDLLRDASPLAGAAAQALSLGKPDAAERLADTIEHLPAAHASGAGKASPG